MKGAASGVGSGEASYNTMSTPRGGQYQLILSDGTRVWLNAASSITYPTSFIEKTRIVSITGEVYFEDSKKPKTTFLVEVADGSKTEVLGTSFNINAYPNETFTRATLIEGKIKVSKNQLNRTLFPYEQAVIEESIIVDTSIDPEQTIASKNGVFNFKNADLPTVMRQLERWYDIEVVYKGKTNQQFSFQENYSAA